MREMNTHLQNVPRPTEGFPDKLPRIPDAIWDALPKAQLPKCPEIIKAIDALLDNNIEGAVSVLERGIRQRKRVFPIEVVLLLYALSKRENMDRGVLNDVQSQLPDTHKKALRFVGAWSNLIFAHRRDKVGVVPSVPYTSATAKVCGRPYR